MVGRRVGSALFGVHRSSVKERLEDIAISDVLFPDHLQLHFENSSCLIATFPHLGFSSRVGIPL